ncbi:MAG: hypothetical protein KIC46_09345 [Clostridiales bacterium]|nr:hypothetical protein [Clostridiales bacterium]
MHGTSAAERWRHVETRSAGRTKTRCLTALKQFVRPFFHRARRGEKIPSRATQSSCAGAASAFRQCSAAHRDAGYETNQKPCFFVHFFLLSELIDKLKARCEMKVSQRALKQKHLRASNCGLAFCSKPLLLLNLIEIDFTQRT